jgi:3-phosphoshikimate 1-carboxyvinyltransferase
MFEFNPRPLKATATLSEIPGDKSISHRSIILGALCTHTVRLRNCLLSEDCLHTIAIFQKLGVSIDIVQQSQCVTIFGVGLDGLKPAKTNLDAGNSGTAIRLISGILAGQSFSSTISGDESIQSRPMERISDPLSLMGAKIQGKDASDNAKKNVFAPLEIHGKPLKGITYTLPIASAQVKSCILLAGLFASGKTQVVEHKPTRNHTEIMLKKLGVPISIEKSRNGSTVISMHSPKSLSFNTSAAIQIPSDFSSASFFIILALIAKQDITIKSISMNPTRNALLKVLEHFGIPVHTTNAHQNPASGISIIPIESATGEDVGDLRICARELVLKNGIVPDELIPLIIDEIPILSIYGLFAQGVLSVRNAGELRVKESDRIQTIVKMISEFGGVITEEKDGFNVVGNPTHTLPNNVLIHTHFDHRIAMSAIIASLARQTPIKLTNTDCIGTSFPNFLDCVSSLYRNKSMELIL